MFILPSSEANQWRICAFTRSNQRIIESLLKKFVIQTINLYVPLWWVRYLRRFLQVRASRIWWSASLLAFFSYKTKAGMMRRTTSAFHLNGELKEKFMTKTMWRWFLGMELTCEWVCGVGRLTSCVVDGWYIRLIRV